MYESGSNREDICELERERELWCERHGDESEMSVLQHLVGVDDLIKARDRGKPYIYNQFIN